MKKKEKKKENGVKDDCLKAVKETEKQKQRME